jgi:2-desacetyl-2-hydroxyethyl bacteriochlorophyllide A dehydrogenase
MKAKRLTFPEKMKVEVEEFELADEPGQDEVLIENIYGLISAGTELAFYTQSHIGFSVPDFGYAKYPAHPGYTAVGRVVKVGQKVSGLAPGDLVHSSSQHASFAVCKATAVLKVPEALPIEQVPFVGMANIAMTTLRMGRPQMGEMAAVFGMGIVGNLAGQLLKRAAAYPVVAIDLVQPRLEVARVCGLDVCWNPSGVDIKEETKKITEGRGFDIVVEATGNPEVASPALKLVGQLGRLILLGSPRGKAELDIYFDIHRKGVSVIGAHTRLISILDPEGPAKNKKLLFKFFADGSLKVDNLITHKIPARDAAQGYQGLIDKKEEYLGVLLDLKEW